MYKDNFSKLSLFLDIFYPANGLAKINERATTNP